MDPVGARLIRAYADGINAYIDRLDPAAVPYEFRLLGRRPERWDPINSLHLMNRMGWTLAYIAPEIERAAAATRVGGAAAAALFPDRDPIVEPIQPNGQTAPRIDTTPLPPPGAPEPSAARTVALLDAMMPTRAARRAQDVDAETDRAYWASNNWAVAPARSATGHALLAGDPHLELTLPSIWYEAHLVVPGKVDAYGVTIPGLPGIVIGFTRDVAWTFTNTGADVLDLYTETVDDTVRPTRYRVDGRWRPIETRVEIYRDKAGAPIAADTLRFTHRGPMHREGRGAGARWVSMRWTVLEPGRELSAFVAGARATTAAAFLDSMSAHYHAPAQNMLVADRAGTIGIRSTGRYPVRPGDGSGFVIRDGSRSASDWRGWLPVSQYPQALAPAQGYLASANQQPVDPRATTAWFGGDYDPWRALRINALLRGAPQVTVVSMRRWQTDPGSARADLFVARFLAAASRPAAQGVDPAKLAEAGRLLGEWDRRYTRENTRAVLFEEAMRQLGARTWDELLEPDTVPQTSGARRAARREGSTARRRVATPSSAILVQLFGDSASPWWDDHRTPAVETRDAILQTALVAALDGTRAQRGVPDDPRWTWSRVRHANIYHLLRLPSLSALDLPVQGGPSTLSPSSGSGVHGASWRMVVELGPELRAWGTYPGGQSGNPLSPAYKDRLPLWLEGRLDSLRVPRRPEEIRGGTTVVLTPATSAR